MQWKTNEKNLLVAECKNGSEHKQAIQMALVPGCRSVMYDKLVEGIHHAFPTYFWHCPWLSVFRYAGAFHAWPSMTITRLIRASSWHERQDLDLAGEDPWQVRAWTWMIELEGLIDRRVKLGLVWQDGLCNRRGWVWHGIPRDQW